MALNREKVLEVAERLIARGKIDAAIEEYRKLLADSPKDIALLNKVGDLYVRISRNDEAVRLFLQLAARYAEDGFFVKAIAIYKKILKFDPTRLVVYEKLADLYHKQGLVNEARSQYQVLVDYHQKHADTQSAAAVLEKMCELDPDDPTPRAPQIISNSYGCPPSEGCAVHVLQDAVEAVRAAGIFMAASAGNNGPACSSVQDPPGLEASVFSVGAVDANNLIAGFSSRGPVTVDGSGRRKPELAAPGVNVRSSYPPNGYITLNGTSMAAPHVAGAVALLFAEAAVILGAALAPAAALWLWARDALPLEGAARVVALSGLARPGGFRRTLEALGAEVVLERAFPDHHRFTPAELDEALRAAAAARCAFVATTEKDAVRLPPARAADPRLRVVRIEAEIVAGAGALDAALDAALAAHPTSTSTSTPTSIPTLPSPRA